MGRNFIFRFSLGQVPTFMWSSSVCLYKLASDRSKVVALSETSQVNTDSQRGVNCALPLVTLKPALSVGQLPGYMHAVRPSSPSQPAHGSRAPELSLCWKKDKNVCDVLCLDLCETNKLNMHRPVQMGSDVHTFFCSPWSSDERTFVVYYSSYVHMFRCSFVV